MLPSSVVTDNIPKMNPIRIDKTMAAATSLGRYGVAKRNEWFATDVDCQSKINGKKNKAYSPVLVP